MPQRQTAPASLIEKIDVDVWKKVFKAQKARTEQNRTEQNRTEFEFIGLIVCILFPYPRAFFKFYYAAGVFNCQKILH